MIVKIEAFQKTPPQLLVWTYTFLTELSFSDFLAKNCILNFNEELDFQYGSYDVDIENWNLEVNQINPDWIKQKDKESDLQITFLPDTISTAMGFREVTSRF